jgi:hypothetical protein
MAVGRISGPLLKANLIRDGVDLAFETDLLYLDVDPGRIGINTTTPQYELDVNGTTRSTVLNVDNQLTIGDLTVSGNTISSTQQTISFIPAPGNSTIYHAKLQVDDLQFTGNTISTTVSNSDIDISANGTGTINLLSNTEISGNLQVTGDISATGNITIGGDLTIGDSDTDTVVINARIASDLIPDGNNLFDLGSPSKKWRSIYVSNFIADTANLQTLTIGDLVFEGNTITTSTGNDLYLDGSGTGGVYLGNFRIFDNAITNVSNNAVSEITQSGTGYLKIVGTNGFVPPRGTFLERPTAYAILGMTRYNTDTKALEVFDGVGWASPAGSAGAVSQEVAEDISITFALTLG